MFKKCPLFTLQMSKDYLRKSLPEKKKNWFAVGFLVVLTIGMSSSFVFFGFNDGSKVVYNGYKFLYKGDHWEVKVNGIIAATTYAPEQVSSITIPAEIASLLQNKVQIDTTSDINDTLKDAISLAQYQMGLTLAAGNVYLRPGFLQNSSNSPQISCDAATPFVPVILFRHSNETKATVEGSCIIAEADTSQKMVLLKDRLLYAMLGLDKQK
jgi:hypothetical protein